MKLALILFLLSANQIFCQQLNNQVSIGGTSDEENPIIKSIPDESGYFVLMGSMSDISGNKSENSFGGYDYWLVKMDNNFNIIWDKTFGGTGLERVEQLLPVSNGVYILGHSESNTSGNKTMNSYGWSDIWVVFVDLDGSIIWQQQYGGDDIDFANDMVEFSDTSILILGDSASGISGNKTITVDPINNFELWLIEVSKSTGAIIQQKVFEPGNGQNKSYIQKNNFNNHYYIGTSANTGITESKSEYGYGSNDCWIIELDQDLNIINEKTFGGSLYEDPIKSFLFEENYIYAFGSSNSPPSGNKTAINHASTETINVYSDFWLLKLNYDLSIEWDKSYGGDSFEKPGNIISLPNGTIVINGSSSSTQNSGNKTSIRYNWSPDIWLLLIQPDGEVLAQESFGGNVHELNSSIHINHNGEYILSALSLSSATGNKTVSTWGGSDAWLSTLSFNSLLTSSISYANLQFGPNPTQDELTVYGELDGEKYLVLDMNSKIIEEGIINSSSNIINISNLSSGLYFLKIGENQFKFIKN